MIFRRRRVTRPQDLEEKQAELNSIKDGFDEELATDDAWHVYYSTLSMTQAALQGALHMAQKAGVPEIILKPFQETVFKTSRELARLKQFFAGPR